jgi:hypothetical protein
MRLPPFNLQNSIFKIDNMVCPLLPSAKAGGNKHYELLPLLSPSTGGGHGRAHQ